MTIDEFWNALRNSGFTPFKVTEDHAIMQGPDGAKTGITHPSKLTPDQRKEELELFLFRNTI